jgi:hypothetical protein
VLRTAAAAARIVSLSARVSGVMAGRTDAAFRSP